jgi:hypothetical protein
MGMAMNIYNIPGQSAIGDPGPSAEGGLAFASQCE